MESIILENAKRLAINIISMCDRMDVSVASTVFSNQIIRCATSIGANVSEANYASSNADFANKLHIALKECNETSYWLEIIQGSGYMDLQTSKQLIHDCGVIRRQLIQSINTIKNS